MAIQVANYAIAAGVTATSIAVPPVYPAIIGGPLIIVFWVNGGTSVSINGTGWTSIIATGNLYAWRRVVDGTERDANIGGSTWTISWTGQKEAGVISLAPYDDAGGDIQFDAGTMWTGQANASSTNITAPALTAPWNADILVNCYMTDTPHTITPPGGQTIILQNATGTVVALAAAYEQLSATGTTGTRVATCGTAAINVGFSFLFRKQSASGTLLPASYQSQRDLLKRTSLTTNTRVLLSGNALNTGGSSISGTCEVGNTPLGNVRVTLRPENAPEYILAETISAADGTYSFTNLPVGTYVVTGVDPFSGYDSVTHHKIVSY